MKLNRIIFLFLSTLWLVPVARAAAPYREFYVAPAGADTNPGTQSRPFATLQRARDAARAVAGQMNGDILINLRGGRYPLDKTVEFTQADSGRNGHQILYKAAAGQKPVFSGGVLVSGWSLHEGRIWKAPLARDHKLRALYVNDQRAVMAGISAQARGGWGEFVVTEGQAPWAWQSGKTADGTHFAAADVPEIARNPEDVELQNQTTWNKNWVCAREIINEGDFRVFKLQQPYGAIAQRSGWSRYAPDGQQVICNAYEFLKQPGQFYFDRAAQTLYYIPRDGEDMKTAQVYAPSLQTLIRVQGKAGSAPVSNLTFEGLTFEHSDWNLVDVAGSHGKVTIQTACAAIAFANSNWHLDAYRAYDTLPGAIEVNAARNVIFRANTIQHTGSEGITLINDVSDCQVVGNVVRDSGGSAITVGHPQHVYENDTPDLKYPTGAGIDKEKFPAGTEAAPRRIVVANNFLPDDAVLFNGHTIITVFFAQDVRIEHNWIINAPYSGINLGWGWCDFDGSDVARHPQWGSGSRPSVFPGKPTTVCQSNSVSANRIENVMTRLRDGGGIYTLGRQPGTVVQRNYVNNAHENGIYTDEGSTGITCRQNVIGGTARLSHAASNNGRKHDIIIDQYYSMVRRVEDVAPNSKATQFTFVSDGIWPMEAYNIIRESGLEAAYRDIVPKTYLPPPADLIFPANVAVAPGAEVALVPASGVAAVWFAPADSAQGAAFKQGPTMTRAPGAAGKILAPTTPGTYMLYATGPSKAVLTVRPPGPAAQAGQ